VDEIADRLVLVNGRILTLDPRRPVVSASAIATGASPRRAGAARSSAVATAPPRVIDLRGAP